VTLACLISSLATLYILVVIAHSKPAEAFHLLGWWPVQPVEVARSCILTFLLYLGPLFEVVVVEKQLQGGYGLLESLSSWQGYRNYVAGPITEEVLFRSVLIPLHILAKVQPSKIVVLTPLYFGIAHVHHFYEFTLTHPHTPLLPAILRTVFQFGFTTVFGWFAAFIYVRTGSLLICIIIHSFCNLLGLPRFWGRLKRREEHPLSPVAIRGKDDTDVVQARGKGGDLGLQWTMAYYVLLLTGVYLFYAGLWPLTVSSQALVKFAGDHPGNKH
jgi:prenyl protein peptidase